MKAAHANCCCRARHIREVSVAGSKGVPQVVGNTQVRPQERSVCVQSVFSLPPPLKKKDGLGDQRTSSTSSPQQRLHKQQQDSAPGSSNSVGQTAPPPTQPGGGRDPSTATRSRSPASNDNPLGGGDSHISCRSTHVYSHRCQPRNSSPHQSTRMDWLGSAAAKQTRPKGPSVL